jgi:two-component system response regulator HupR/HoxA
MSRPRLLIVDDEPANRDLLRRILGRDFQVTEADGADTAIAALEAAGSVDLMLCDQVMPGRSGAQLSRVVRERWPDVVILLLTGTEDAPEVVAVRTEGVVAAVVGKPWSLPDLREAVARAMKR